NSESNSQIEAKPFIFSIGQGMFLKALDEFLIGKEEGKHYTVELEPEKAFGKRNAVFIHRIPSKIFKEKKITPFIGLVLNFDGRMGKVIAVSGGRVMVDFNSPLAGKDVVYEIKILRKVENLQEKVKALNEFLFRKNLDFEIKEKKIIFSADKDFAKIIELFKEKFKEILDLDIAIKEIEKKKDKVKEE
ncbi:hypothetical protein FJZ20_02075, partial [Candidatus Pacearchaeota archaeon]|nr:hypothetical protein [Candidatus Pacearchaeota archaeon]